MGLFDFLKKKAPTHREKVEMAYKCYKTETVSTMFPQGLDQADKIIVSLAQVYGLNLEDCDAKKYYDILSTYSNVLIRKVVTNSLDDRIVASLLVKHGALVTDKSMARKALAYCMLNMKDNEFMLKTSDDIAVMNLFADTLAESEKIDEKCNKTQDDNSDDLEYGIVANKPIYTKGVSGSNEYLNNLRTISGDKLTWTRSGSMSLRGQKDIVDIYEGFLPTGELYKTLYVNMYATANSAGFPEGFSTPQQLKATVTQKTISTCEEMLRVEFPNFNELIKYWAHLYVIGTYEESGELSGFIASQLLNGFWQKIEHDKGKTFAGELHSFIDCLEGAKLAKRLAEELNILERLNQGEFQLDNGGEIHIAMNP